MAERVLTLRELNRATLTRQLLLERASLAPLDAIKQLAGLQAQLSNLPYIGLWSRLHAFQRNDLTHLLEQRQVVRTSMMRRTLHLTTAEDYMRFRPALQSLHTRDLNAYFTRYRWCLGRWWEPCLHGGICVARSLVCLAGGGSALSHSELPGGLRTGERQRSANLVGSTQTCACRRCAQGRTDHVPRRARARTLRCAERFAA